MKKPSNLKLKEDNKVKRNKSIPNNFESRKKNYNELKELREILKQKKSDVADSMRAERKRIEEKRKRKELNDIKSGKYDVVKNPQKIKKWKRKARKMLQKIPPEIFYENAK